MENTSVKNKAIKAAVIVLVLLGLHLIYMIRVSNDAFTLGNIFNIKNIILSALFLGLVTIAVFIKGEDDES
jgi:hypothetical protein